MKMAEISPLPLLPETPSPPLPDAKLLNHFAANKTRKEQLEMFSKTSKQQQQHKMFTGSKTSKEELLSCNKTDKQENLFIPPARVKIKIMIIMIVIIFIIIIIMIINMIMTIIMIIIRVQQRG